MNMVRTQADAREAKDKATQDVLLGRCVPIARAIMKLMIDDELDMGVLPSGGRGPDGKPLPMDPTERPQKYRDAAAKVLGMFKDAGLKWEEKELVFQLLKQPFDLLSDIVITDSNRTLNRAIARMFETKFDVEFMSQMTFNQVDAFVKEWPPKEADAAKD